MDEHAKDLQVYEMRTSSPVKRESLLDKMVDGVFLSALIIGLVLIGAVYGYLLANM